LIGTYDEIKRTGAVHAQGAVSFLDDKPKLDTTDAFVPEKKATASKQSIADFKARKSNGS